MAGQPPTLQYVDFPIFNALIPKEGPKAVPFYFDWNSAQAYDVDLQNQQSRNFISMVQTLWIDNSLNDHPVSIAFGVIGQNLKAPPRWQGYFPVMVVNPPRFTVSSVGSTLSTQISLMNVPFPAAAWSSLQSTGTFDSNGNMLVSDVILEQAVSAGKFNVAQYVQGANDTFVPQFNAAVMSVVTATLAGDTAVLNNLAANNFFISSIDISLSGNASLAVAGNLTITLKRNTFALWQRTVSLPAAAGTGAIIDVAHLTGLNYISAGQNEDLFMNLSASLATGVCTANIGCGYTTTPRP